MALPSGLDRFALLLFPGIAMLYSVLCIAVQGFSHNACGSDSVICSVKGVCFVTHQEEKGYNISLRDLI